MLNKILVYHLDSDNTTHTQHLQLYQSLDSIEDEIREGKNEFFFDDYLLTNNSKFIGMEIIELTEDEIEVYKHLNRCEDALQRSQFPPSGRTDGYSSSKEFVKYKSNFNEKPNFVDNEI